MNSALEFVSQNIGVIGGWTAVFTVFCGITAWVANFLANRSMEKHKSTLNSDLETHKSSLSQKTEALKSELNQSAERLKLDLKKQEIIFNKEIDCFSAFAKLRRSVFPKANYPDYDSYDASVDINDNLFKIEQLIEDFEISHGVALREDARIMLESCKQICSNYKFERFDNPERTLSKQAEEGAFELMRKLTEVESAMHRSIKTWDAPK